MRTPGRIADPGVALAPAPRELVSELAPPGPPGLAAFGGVISSTAGACGRTPDVVGAERPPERRAVLDRVELPPPGASWLVGESSVALALPPTNISLRSAAIWRASP